MEKLDKQKIYSRTKKTKIVSDTVKEEIKQNVKSGNMILASLNTGLFGFAIVLTLVILTKLLAFSFGSSEILEFKINDVIFSLWGFLILSFIKLVSYHKK